MRAKYIILMDSHGIEHAIVFSPIMKHSDLKVLEDDVHTKIVSAGLVLISTVDGEPTFQCYGESISLKIGGRGETDSAIIKLNYAD